MMVIYSLVSYQEVAAAFPSKKALERLMNRSERQQNKDEKNMGVLSKIRFWRVVLARGTQYQEQR